MRTIVSIGSTRILPSPTSPVRRAAGIDVVHDDIE
jgi:hypothetical protein